MLIRYCLIFFVMIYSISAYGWWDEVARCLTNPCNCGYSPINETWNGQLKRTIDPDAICPPWNRRDGRDSDNCLIQFNPPEKFTQLYLQHCAERTQESSYFTPKIRVRTQTCNAFACWHLSTTLNWDGQCMMWPSAYALPLFRICARVALPEVKPTHLNAKGTPADPGYTVGKHLNDVGAEENDRQFIGSDGKVFSYDRPKLCAYSDPGLFNLVSNTGIHIDPFDFNPIRQPLHKTHKLHPLAKVLLFIIEQKTELNPLVLLVKALTVVTGNTGQGGQVMVTAVKWIDKISNGFGWIAIEEALKAFGALNRSVDDYKFGCVELPFGPFPPPYCPTLQPFTITPTTKTVCSKKDKNQLFIQSSDSPCVVSKLRNNLIHNTVRISLDNLVPLCRNKEDPQQTDKCVEIKNLGLLVSAKAMHIASAQHDNIKKCVPGDTRPCVNTKIQFQCSVDNNGCEDGFRIVYGQKIDSRSMPSDYYVDDLPDCGTENSANQITCQEVWGINTGEFVDVALNFPKVQDSSNAVSLLPLKQTVNLKDKNGQDRSFVASIVREAVVDNTLDPPFNRNPHFICVTEGDSLVDCEKRVMDNYQILTYQCEGLPGITCPNNSYYTPQFIASIRVADDQGNEVDSTSTVVTPLSLANPVGNNTESVINLAGYHFSSFMAYISPPTYTAMPFSGSKSINPLTVYGNYKDNKVPYNPRTGQVISDAVYLNGLEYINGKYIQGGTHGCLQSKETSKCLPGIDNSKCVLAKLLETDKIDCVQFRQKVIYYQNRLLLCQNTDSGCTVQETVDGITIYKCDNSVYCYRNNRNSDTQVCAISFDTQNRVIPEASIGTVINKSDQHYIAIDEKTNKIKYNEKVEIVRDKTSEELGLCTPVPVPKCPAIATATNNSGNATWPETDVGTLAIGTCRTGWTLVNPNKPLQRYCLSNASTRTIAFEPLPSDVGCKEFNGLDFQHRKDKQDFPIQSNYDRSTKVGTIVLGGGYGSAAHTWGTLYCVNSEFDIPDISALRSFTIGGTESYYDDYITIAINNQLIHTGPSAFEAIEGRNYNADRTHCTVYIKRNGNFEQARDSGRAVAVPQLNLMPYLQNGRNNIKACVGMAGGGTLILTIRYQLE